MTKHKASKHYWDILGLMSNEDWRFQKVPNLQTHEITQEALAANLDTFYGKISFPLRSQNLQKARSISSSGAGSTSQTRWNGNLRLPGLTAASKVPCVSPNLVKRRIKQRTRKMVTHGSLLAR